jgi:phosphoesterase RecJ-like protein
MAADLLSVSSLRREGIERLARELNSSRTGRSVVLSTHINADGDGCGSEAALARLLGQLGFTVTIVNPTPWPEMFNFLIEDANTTDQFRVVEALEGGAEIMSTADIIIVLDISDLRRLSALGDVVRAFKGPVLVIDHHVPSEEPPGTEVFSDTTACATGELIYDFASVLGLEITPAIAEGIYTAILTDTGGFRFSNTSPRSHAIASQLLAKGVDPEAMYQRIYASVPIGRLRFLRDALANLDVDPAYGLSWIAVTANTVEQHRVRPEDLSGMVEYARSIAGTRMAIFFREIHNNRVKISFRTTGNTDANAFARQFGGGGHVKAAGAIVDGTLEEVQHRVISAAREYLQSIS